MRYIVILIFLFNLLTAQTITAVSADSIVTDSSIVIYGSSFGSKSTAAPLKYDNFKSGIDGERIPTESEGGWYNWASVTGQEPQYSDSIIRITESMSCYQNFHNASGACYLGLTDDYTIPLNTTTIYFSGWFWETRSVTSSRNEKYLNFTAGDWQSRLDVYPTNGSGHLYAHSTCEGGGPYHQDYSIGANFFTQGTWNRIEGWLDMGDPEIENALRWVSLNGDELARLDNAQFRDAYCSLDQILIGHYYATDGNTNVYADRFWDEIYIDTIQARVEIGNNSVFANCSHREIQVPTAWATDEITITFNQGSFEADDNVWLFVIDSDGDVSSGYAVTIGGEGSGEAPATGDGSKVDVINIEKE